MKRSLFVSMVLVIAALVTAPSSATGQSPGTDSVSGFTSQCIEFVEVPGLTLCARRLSLTVEVESGPAGENPGGSISWNQLGLTPGGSPSVTAEATCLSVSGNVAIIGVTGTWRLVAGNLEMPIAGLIRVVDAGGPSAGADTFQFALQVGAVDGPPLPGPSSCSTFPGTFPTDSNSFPSFTNAAGDVVVTDTLPFPTSNDQCGGGGWRNFPGFKNQGDCISFVATGGKNPPAGSQQP